MKTIGVEYSLSVERMLRNQARDSSESQCPASGSRSGNAPLSRCRDTLASVNAEPCIRVAGRRRPCLGLAGVALGG